MVVVSGEDRDEANAALVLTPTAPCSVWPWPGPGTNTSNRNTQKLSTSLIPRPDTIKKIDLMITPPVCRFEYTCAPEATKGILNDAKP